MLLYPSTFNLLFFYVSQCFVLHICLCTTWVQCLGRPEEGANSCETRDIDICKPPYGLGKLTLRSSRSTASAFNCWAILQPCYTLLKASKKKMASRIIVIGTCGKNECSSLFEFHGHETCTIAKGLRSLETILDLMLGCRPEILDNIWKVGACINILEEHVLTCQLSAKQCILHQRKTIKCLRNVPSPKKCIGIRLVIEF